VILELKIEYLQQVAIVPLGAKHSNGDVARYFNIIYVSN
jgi:hypothetical protein